MCPSYTGIAELVGRTFVKVEANEYEMTLDTAEGVRYRFYHSQECCESVYIESIVGDLSDLVGEPLLISEQVDGVTPESLGGECEEWTFYKFATRKGYVDVRWYGDSNGYYSTSVDLIKEEC
jgi:hypothetical protein